MSFIRRIGVLHLFAVVALVALALASGAAYAAPSIASQTIKMVGFKFAPQTLTVPVGTTITWTNQDSAGHTATSDTGIFDTGNVATGQSMSITFNKAGTFPYYCKYHGGPGGDGMAGTIVVTAAQGQPVPVLPNTGRTDDAITGVLLVGFLALLLGYGIQWRSRKTTR